MGRNAIETLGAKGLGFGAGFWVGFEDMVENDGKRQGWFVSAP